MYILYRCILYVFAGGLRVLAVCVILSPNQLGRKHTSAVLVLQP